MRPVMIVIHPPSINNVSRLGKAQEQFTVQAFIPQLTVKALNISILPRTSRLDEQCSDLFARQPFLDGLTRELRAVIATNVSRPAADSEQLCQYSYNIFARKMPANLYGQGLACELVNNVQHSQPAATFRTFRDEVVTPDVVLAHRLMPMAGIGSCAQSPAFTGLLAYLKTFRLP